jgi:hypothetical protein
LEHKDATDKDLPIDPDATGIAAQDVEAMLHRELDARKKKTVPLMRAAPRLSPPPRSVRVPAASTRIPLSKSPIPRAPIHTLPPTFAEEEHDDDATSIFDRSSSRTSVRTVVPSVRFPAANFSPPRAPQPFSTIPAIPAAKRVEDSQGLTPLKEVVLAPTSRREIRLAPPSAFDSVPPQAMSIPPAAMNAPSGTSRSTMVAMALTLMFCVLTMVSIVLAVFKPQLIVRGKQAVATAMQPKQPPTITVAAAQPPPAAPTVVPAVAPVISVPPILVDEPSSELTDDQSVLVFPESMHGRRVFIDGKAVGDGDAPIVTTCGKHTVKLTSAGTSRTMDLPCGGGVHVDPDAELKYGF